MNSTFKVVFNKARGALMVVNEVTSSVQAKGTKTVVATAVAAMIAGVAGTAMAADAKVVVNDIEAESDVITLTEASTIAKKFDVKAGGTVNGNSKILSIATGGTSYNKGTIAGLNTLEIGANDTFKNETLTTTDTLTVYGTVETGILAGKADGATTPANHLQFTTANLEEGGKVVITEYLRGCN